MPDTITTYNDFAGGNRAYADDVDENFANHRGTILPIYENTAAASDNVHDLGATDHRIRKAYLANAPYVNGVQVNQFEIENIYDGSVPTELVDPVGDLERICFPPDRDTEIRFKFRVPPDYVIGQRIGLSLHGYPETTGSSVFHLTTRLYRPGTTSITGTSTPAAVLTSTGTFANSVAGLVVEDTTMKFTDGNGLVNGATVSVGDIITAQLKRAATATADTNTGDFFAIGLFCQLNN